jgi:hypothetical protein
VGSYNPYSPPGALDAPPALATTTRLFGPAAIAAHTVLLTPIMGAVLASINHRRLGDAARARRTLLMYLVPSIVLAGAQVASNQRLGGILRFVSLGWSIAVARQLYVEHRVIFDAHAAAGGKAARWYLATLIALGILVAALLVASLSLLDGGMI